MSFPPSNSSTPPSANPLNALKPVAKTPTGRKRGGQTEPSWHQVAELAVLAAVVTEHQAHARTCPGSGLVNHAVIPPQVRAHVIGLRLAATMCYLSGRFHLSKRSVTEYVEAALDVPVSLGTVAVFEQQTSAALATAHDQARDEVRDAPVKNADETG